MPPRLRKGLWVALPVIAITGLAVELMHHGVGPEAPEDLVALFSLSFEGNLPTWYSSALLLGCGILLAAIAARAASHRRHWGLLAGVFVYMSLDEVATLHERLNGLVELGGVLTFGWVIPAALVVAALGIAYLPFLRALPATTRRRFIVAGAIYVGGALLMELPLGLWTSGHGDENLGYVLIDFVEETMEMTGATLFLLALEDHRGT